MKTQTNAIISITIALILSCGDRGLQTKNIPTSNPVPAQTIAESSSSANTAKVTDIKAPNLDIVYPLHIKNQLNDSFDIQFLDIFFDSKESFIERSKNQIKKLDENLSQSKIEKIILNAHAYQKSDRAKTQQRLEKIKNYILSKNKKIAITTEDQSDKVKKYNSSKDNRVEILIYQRKY